MQVEQLTFNQYAAELHSSGLLSDNDLLRVRNSLEAKGIGFVHDLCSLAADLRLGLSTCKFQLSDHTNKVFHRARRSVLPCFLKGALQRVFDKSSGQLREDYCLETAAKLNMFCDALKRIDPPTDHAPMLEQKVWSSLRENFEDAPNVRASVISQLQHDVAFRSLFFRARDYFRERLENADMTKVPCGTGPGKNTDRYDASTSSDWTLSTSCEIGPHSAPILRAVRRWFNHHPFKPKRSRKSTVLYGPVTGRRLPLGAARMKCSAQPKSYKAYRGVGVTRAARMAAQISLQRMFYRDCLNEQLPLRDQTQMTENLRNAWKHVGTIDLSTASDRLYWFLLYGFGSGVPWFDAAFELRTRYLELPDGEIETASPVMGEAITFPLLSLFFYSIAMAVCDEQGGGHQFVRIYGDDIQTPWYQRTLEVLQQFGAKPSVEKSYPPTSCFKESCEAHYVARDGMLRSARPCFIPSGVLNIRNRLCSVDVYKLLVLAKDSFMRNPELSNAACCVVEEHSSLKRLPKVSVLETSLGRPTLSSSDPDKVELVMKEDDEHLISVRGMSRLMLRSIGQDAPNDLKLSTKVKYKHTMRTLKAIRIRNASKELEEAVFAKLCRERLPDLFDQAVKAQLTNQDIKSIVISRLSDDEICEYIAELINKLHKV